MTEHDLRMAEIATCDRDWHDGTPSPCPACAAQRALAIEIRRLRKLSNRLLDERDKAREEVYLLRAWVERIQTVK